MLKIEYHCEIDSPQTQRRIYNRVLNVKARYMAQRRVRLNDRTTKNPDHAHVTPSGSIVLIWSDDSHGPIICNDFEGKK